MTNITFDNEANAWYIYFSGNKIIKTIAVNDKVICDLDNDWMIVWIELIWVKNEEFKKNIQDMKYEVLV